MEKQTINVSVWKRYNTYELEIAPSLTSASHSFEYRGKLIKITLPRLPKQKNWHKEDSQITCWGYRKRNSRKIPLSYSVHQVDAVIDTGKARKIRKDALRKVNVGLFRKSERNRLDKLTYLVFERILRNV